MYSCKLFITRIYYELFNVNLVKKWMKYRKIKTIKNFKQT